jgi:hypothetical protein
MKTYGINPRTFEIKNKEETLYSLEAIEMGEKGVGRKYLLVPCPLNFTYLQPGTTKSGKIRLCQSDSSDGWIVHINAKGAYLRDARGRIKIQSGITYSLLEKAYGAFGIAGRVGSWDDVLISVSAEFFFLLVKPTRGEKYYISFKDGKATKLTPEEFDIISIDEEISFNDI